MNSDRIFLGLVPLIRPWVVANARKRQARFASESFTPGGILFLGDSITQRGDWVSYFPDLAVVNRGIDGDTTEDVLARLDEALNSPRLVSLLIGTNDLHKFKDRLKDPAGIAWRVDQILTRIRASAPNATILLNSMMPRTELFADRIQEINYLYRGLAERHGATYIDLWPALADENGALRKAFTSDNLHLKRAGYEAWSAVLRPYLASKV